MEGSWGSIWVYSGVSMRSAGQDTLRNLGSVSYRELVVEGLRGEREGGTRLAQCPGW